MTESRSYPSVIRRECALEKRTEPVSGTRFQFSSDFARSRSRGSDNLHFAYPCIALGAAPGAANYPLRALHNHLSYEPFTVHLRRQYSRWGFADRTRSAGRAPFQRDIRRPVNSGKQTPLLAKTHVLPSRFMPSPRESREKHSLVRSFMNFYAGGFT